MNERIKELAKEAALVYKIIPPPATHTTPLYLIDNFKKNEGPAGIKIISDGFCEKFAELIVRECVKAMYDNAIERKVPPDINQTPTHYAVAVLEHFGVEE